MNLPFLNDAFFSRLETLSLNLQKDLTGYFGGKHLIKKYGQTIEFADFRQYELGDDIRRIDWNLYARLKKYYLKLYTDERQMHVQILLDCSASMGVYREKAQYAMAMAAALGYLAVRNTDKISYHFLKDSYADDPFGLIVGTSRFFGSIGEFSQVTFSGEADFANSIQKIPNTGTNDGLTVIISDFLTENNWQKAVDYLLYKKRQIILVQVLTKEEIRPVYSGRIDLIDSEATAANDGRNLHVNISRSMLREYDKLFQEYIQEIKEFCAPRGVTFLSIGTDQPVERVIFRELLRSELAK